MPLAGRWHIVALVACLAVWLSLNPKHAVPCALLAGYGLFLIVTGRGKLLAVLLAVVLLIVLDTQLFRPNRSRLSGNEKMLSGKISGIPEFDGDRVSYEFRTDIGETVAVVLSLGSAKQKQQLKRTLKPGLIGVVAGSLEKPSGPTNFHAFDYSAYLFHRHIFWQLQANGPPHIVSISDSPADKLIGIRQAGMEQVDNRFTPAAAGMINALVFGEENRMDPDLVDAYQLFGLVHLLVVSGTHIAVLLGGLYYLCRRVGLVREYTCAGLLLLLPAYVLLTGAEPSIVRSALTAALFLLIGLLKNRDIRPTDVPAIACLAMIFYDPHVVFDLGFQLSFAVTFTLLIAAPIVAARYRSSVLRLFVIAMIAETAAFPIAVYHFYQFSYLNFFLSLFFVPLLTFLILPLATAAVLAMVAWPPSVVLFSQLIAAMLGVPHRLLDVLYRHRTLMLNYGALTPWMLAAAIILLAAGLLVWEHFDGPRSLLLLFSSFFLIYLMIHAADALDPHGSVTFLDVGQGDSILIRLPHAGGAILIDSGGVLPYARPDWQKRRRPFDVGRDVVLHELRAMRVDRLDVAVLTHKDYDHIGGMSALAGVLPIDRLAVSPFFDPEKDDLTMMNRAIDSSGTLMPVRTGDRIRVADATLTVLGPLRRNTDGNGNSVVIGATLGGKQWMFTGDLPSEGEQELLADRQQPRVDILKLGHHGSRTSTSDAWLQTLRPSIGIISCGRNNRYGHPHPEVLARLKKYGVRAMRTDRSGAIRFDFTDKRMTAVRTAVR